MGRGQWEQGGGKEGGLAGDGEGEGVGEGRAQVGGGMVGDGDHAAVLAQSASVKKTQPVFQMHRDLNAAHGTCGTSWLQSMLGCLGQHI